MKKVFVLICEGFCDYVGETHAYVFSTYEKAKSQFDYYREESIDEWVTNGYWVVDDDSKNSFCVCEEGDYTRNRFVMRIEEKEIDN
jgi:hypothetical protein